MEENECFTCGAKWNTTTFRYVVEDQGVSDITYHICNTKCLADLAESEREYNSDEDYLESGA